MHVVLAIEPRILQNALKEILEGIFESPYVVHEMDYGDDEIAVAVFLRSLLGDEPFDPDEPVALIISIDDEAKVPAVCSRLLDEFPELVVFGINRYTRLIRSYRMRIRIQPLAETLDSLKEALHFLSLEPRRE